MKPLYVLIDFENVQPKVLDRLRPGAFRVKVFLGQHQSKLMLDLVQRLQPFGSDAEYIQIQGSGPDAVDFHIAFYVGRIAAAEPAAAFIIVSKDKGFDPLIKHLLLQGIECRRMAELPDLSVPVEVAAPAKVPVAKRSEPGDIAATPKGSAVTKTARPATPAATTRARAKAVVEHLKRSTKPAKVSTLRSSIKAWFQPPLDDKAVAAVLQSLQDSKQLQVTGTKVTYSLG